MALTEKGLVELKNEYPAIMAYINIIDAALNCKDVSDAEILQTIKSCNDKLIGIINNIEYLDSWSGKPI